MISFLFYFKWIIFISTGSVILVSKYSNELDKEYKAEFDALILFVLLWNVFNDQLNRFVNDILINRAC